MEPLAIKNLEEASEIIAKATLQLSDIYDMHAEVKEVGIPKRAAEYLDIADKKIRKTQSLLIRAMFTIAMAITELEGENQ